MNLQQFIDFRSKCPICDGNLFTQFHSNRRQVVKYENERAKFTMWLDTLIKKQQPYKAAYSFGLLDNSVVIEFYTKDDKHFYEESPEFLRKRFLELHDNLNKANFRFSRECANNQCLCYNYYSNFFQIDLKRACFEELDVRIEQICLSHPLPNEKFRNYKLVNHLNLKKTNLSFWKDSMKIDNVYNMIYDSITTNLELPLIPFVSVEETIKRLNSLIIFS